MNWPLPKYKLLPLLLLLIHIGTVAQINKARRALPDSLFITKYDTLLHLQSWISANQMEYRFIYDKDFRLILTPNDINNLSFGFSYRYLDLGLSFTPQFMNEDDIYKKGESKKFTLAFGFSMHRFHLSFDLTAVKGFYLRNSVDFGRHDPDSPYFQFPNLRVGYFSTLLSYNCNPKFSTAALGGGTQVQRQSAWTLNPTFQFATFRFNSKLDTPGVHTETTYSTDVNLILPVLGTYVFTPKISGSLGIGPSIGVDFFKSVSLDNNNKLVTAKGTKPTTGYTLQSALAYSSVKFFCGFEYRFRSYGHQLEQLERLEKQYSYFQIYFGWRLQAPGFLKKSLDWANKVSPVKFE